MRLATILLAACTTLCGCEIFLEDWGAEGAPCGGNEDCQKHLICNPEHVCIKGVDFGQECGVSQDCGGKYPECICHPAVSKCHCTRSCFDPDECLEEGARCALTDPLSADTFCAHPAWTYDEFGALCKSEDTTCAAGVCSPFEIRTGGKICVKECGMCPPGASCSEPFAGMPTVCGYPAWFGFGAPCATDQQCGDRFPEYPVCPNGFCTIECSNVNPCKAGMRCEPPAAGTCVPDR